MEEVQYQAKAAQVPCVEHKIPPAICCILAGTSKRVVCLHQCRQGGDMRLIPGLGAGTLCLCLVWSNKCGGKRKDLLIIAGKTLWRLVVEVPHCSEMGLF